LHVTNHQTNFFMKNIYLFIILIIFSENLNAQEFSGIINNHFEELFSKGEMLQEDLHWELSSQHISSTSKVNHIYFYQTVKGVKIYNTESSIHLLPNGDVLSTTTNFINNSSKNVKRDLSNTLTSIEVTKSIAKQLGYSIKEPLQILDKKVNSKQNIYISNGGISLNDIKAKLVYKLNDKNELILIWEINILELSFEHSWLISADAFTGKIIDKIDLVVSCSTKRIPQKVNINSDIKKIDNLGSSSENCEECYKVFEMPIESPYYGERSIVTNPTNNIASPFGWHDVDGLIGNDYTTTRGNNINAFLGPDRNEGYQPNGGSTLDFSEYDFDQDFSLENRYANASLTNLFYWGNMLHDILFVYGFNGAAGNFQENDFGLAGADDDSLYVIGQHELSNCNAYYFPSDDGERSYIRLNACGDKDGAFDNFVIVHEYAHGLFRRLVGGGYGGSICRNVETPSEGWSDWYGLMFTISPEDISTKPRGVAEYFFDQGENGQGIREYPYSTDMNISPETYDDIKKYRNKHAIGSIWTSILWEITWALIDEYGYDPNLFNFTGDINQDAGNIIALAIVTESLKIVDCPSGFIDARDAVIEAYLAIYGAGNECLLWEAFAKRGLGIYATQGSTTSVEDGREDFTVPPRSAEFDFYLDEICPNANKIRRLEGGLPYGGIYSGVGVIDNGNGTTFSFEPLVAGIGVHTVTYEILDSECTEASSSSGTIEVVVDTTAPEITCPENVVVTIPADKSKYSLIDFSSSADLYDNCFDEFNFYQKPIGGTYLEAGDYTIEIEVSDVVGNQSSCTFILNVKKEEVLDDFIEIYPNPTQDEIIMLSYKKLFSLKTSIYDVNGKLIQSNEILDYGFEKKLNIKNLTAGMYFLKIDGVEFSTVKRILKE